MVQDHDLGDENDVKLTVAPPPQAALKCTNCGIRRLVRLEVLGDDGNPMAVDDVRWCTGCNRIYRVVEDGLDKVKLQLVVANTTMMSLRAL